MKPWTFVHATDIHVGSPKSFRYAPAWNENWRAARQQIIDLEPDLLLIGGDLARDGRIHLYEFQELRNDLDSLPFPYHVIPGNMDTNNKHTVVSGKRPGRNDLELNMTMKDLGNYRQVFGSPWWTFTHKSVRFSGFGGMLLGSGLALEKDLWAWLESQIDQPRSQGHIWLMHYPPFVHSPDEPSFDVTDLDEYQDWYFNVDKPYRERLLHILMATGATHVLSGHTHVRKRLYAEGIHFDVGMSTAFTQRGPRWNDGDHTLGLQKYVVSEDGIDYEFIPLATVSTATGYGPGGHPRPDQRDYSIAWERDTPQQ